VCTALLLLLTGGTHRLNRAQLTAITALIYDPITVFIFKGITTFILGYLSATRSPDSIHTESYTNATRCLACLLCAMDTLMVITHPLNTALKVTAVSVVQALCYKLNLRVGLMHLRW